MPRNNKRSTQKAGKAAKKTTFTHDAVEAIKEAPKTAEARVKALIESGKPALERAQAFASETRKNLKKSVADIGTRVEKERKSLGKRVEGVVKTTLASLNIPTRSEINLLAKRVEELSRKIDSLKRK